MYTVGTETKVYANKPVTQVKKNLTILKTLKLIYS